MAKTTQDVLDVLNEVLTGELTAINQYFIHAKMCGDWGYDKLPQKVRHESIDEMIEDIKQIDQNEERYQSYINEPLFVDNTID